MVMNVGQHLTTGITAMSNGSKTSSSLQHINNKRLIIGLSLLLNLMCISQTRAAWSAHKLVFQLKQKSGVGTKSLAYNESRQIAKPLILEDRMQATSKIRKKHVHKTNLLHLKLDSGFDFFGLDLHLLRMAEDCWKFTSFVQTRSKNTRNSLDDGI